MTDSPAEILLVEDNPTELELMLRALKKHNVAARIRVARDGAEALEFLFGRDAFPLRQPAALPRVILLDLKLPRVDGWEVLRRIKCNPRTRPIPVVVVTSSHEEHDLIECYHAGANSYIVKPVDFAQFTEIVRWLGLYWLELNLSPLSPAATGDEG